MRLLDRDPLLEAGNRSGAFTQSVVTQEEFSANLRAYPDIEGLIRLCVAYQVGVASEATGSGQVDLWLTRLGELLAALRVSTPS